MSKAAVTSRRMFERPHTKQSEAELPPFPANRASIGADRGDARWQRLPSEWRARPVLILDDEFMTAWALQDMMADLGFTDIRIVPDYPAAIAAAEERPPALLICDVNLGGGPNGIATAARLRGLHDAPVLFVTGYDAAQIGEEISALCAGAGLLSKPVAPGLLKKALCALLAKPDS